MPRQAAHPRARRPRGAGTYTTLLVAGFLAGVGLFAACAASGDGDMGETASSSGSGGNIGFDGGSGGGINADAACATASDEAQPVPLNLYIMFDMSGSMADKWFNATKALQTFFMDPESAGLRVALRFFPNDGCDEGCNVNACAQPKVPLGELTALSAPTDTHEQALIDAFIGLTTQGETPLSAALDGALQWGMGYLNQTSGEKAAVVLVTDGAPTDCNTTQGYLTGAAAGALASHGLLTFAIGLDGSNEGLMNAIAAAGGTGQGYYIGSGSDVEAELVAAFDEIRDATIACEYRVPDEAGGEPIEPTAVNVLYTPAGSTASTTIGQVGGHDACTTQAGGWYYDNPADPTKIIFCPSTCSAVQNDNGGRVDLIFGCATIPA